MIYGAHTKKERNKERKKEELIIDVESVCRTGLGCINCISFTFLLFNRKRNGVEFSVWSAWGI